MSDLRASRRGREPRVLIEFETLTSDGWKSIELRFVIGVLASLAGKSSSSAAKRRPAERTFTEIDAKSFDSKMHHLAPRVVYTVDNVLSGGPQIVVDLEFKRLADFSPDCVARAIPELAEQLQTREILASLRNGPDGQATANDWLQLAASNARVATVLAGALVADARPDAAEGGFTWQRTRDAVAARIATIDRALSAQLDLILHHEHFRQLEAAWRGLRYLVDHTQTNNGRLEIAFLNLSKTELREMLARYPGVGWDQSPLFKEVYERGYGQLGGHPFGCLLGDYEFDDNPVDLEILKGMGRIAAAAHCPFVAAPSPSLFDGSVSSWSELVQRDPKKVFGNKGRCAQDAWRGLRRQEDSRYLAMALPRLLGRPPYGTRTRPCDALNYDEAWGAHDDAGGPWINAAYAFGAVVARAFEHYGWCSRIRGIESGGNVEDLSQHPFATDDGFVDLRCATEAVIDERWEAGFAGHGFMAVCHQKNTAWAAFIGADSIHLPDLEHLKDAVAVANARLGARLPYIFAASRFAHYLKAIVRNKVGSGAKPRDVARDLQDWVRQYCAADTGGATEELLARRPLSDASIDVIETGPGVYDVTFRLKPHYQLEGINVELSLSSESGRASAN